MGIRSSTPTPPPGKGTAEQVLAKIETRIAPVQREAAEIIVKDESTAKTAADFLSHIKTAAKEIEAERKTWVDPLNTQVRRLNALFKPKLDVLEQAENTVKAKIAAWINSENRRRYEEAEKLRKAQEKKYEKAVDKAEKKGVEPPPPPSPLTVVEQKGLVGSSGAVQSKQVWTFKVTNERAVPRQFLRVDETLIRAAMNEGVKTTGEPPEIAGVTFEQETQVAVTV